MNEPLAVIREYDDLRALMARRRRDLWILAAYFGRNRWLAVRLFCKAGSVDQKFR